MLSGGRGAGGIRREAGKPEVIRLVQENVSCETNGRRERMSNRLCADGWSLADGAVVIVDFGNVFMRMRRV